ncbi:hypothetical protein PHYPSEUDO_015119 [Phytophthora pseudosyringae]|uniref:BZIP domain-containing protein n=1 Tax=Phytophthora pseudosyringae TaxID=221518 RepID=A0A8T1W4D1_9STRA|nr:hypothetical protein PHYPSEUDO_015119 [Phytophthora pseudosyringae]
MPRKPHRRTVKLEPLSPPMATRSLTRANKSLDDIVPDNASTTKTATVLRKPMASKARAVGKRSKPARIVPKLIGGSTMPALASLIAAALKTNCLVHDSPPPPIAAKSETTAPSLALAPASLLRAGTPPPAAPSPTVAPTISPSSKQEIDRPKRRKREPIKLPPGVAVAKLSAKDLRRLKNRIAAMRLRQRSQQSIQSLQDQLEYFRSRCEFLELVVSSCPTCASISAVQFGAIELLPAEPKKINIKSEEPSAEEELEDDDDDLTVLTETECVVLDNVLHC